MKAHVEATTAVLEWTGDTEGDHTTIVFQLKTSDDTISGTPKEARLSPKATSFMMTNHKPLTSFKFQKVSVSNMEGEYKAVFEEEDTAFNFPEDNVITEVQGPGDLFCSFG